VSQDQTTTFIGCRAGRTGQASLDRDLDPQGNATTGLGVDGRQFERSVYDVLLNDVRGRIVNLRLQQPIRRSGNTRLRCGSNRELTRDLSRVANEEGFNLRRGGFDTSSSNAPSLGLIPLTPLPRRRRIMVPVPD